jgi:uncharacterized protein (AIM24 family)
MQGQTYQFLGSDFQMPQPLMVHQIHGRPAFSYGNVQVQQGHSVIADGDAMLWMDGALMMDTECYGGCVASCARGCAGENVCMNKFSGFGDVAFGFKLPGDMLAFGITADFPWLLKAESFVAGTDNLIVSADFAGCGACCCTEMGPFVTTVRIDPDKGGDQGVFLAGGYGFLERHDIPGGKTFMVSGGNFFAAKADTQLELALAGGCYNLCCANFDPWSCGTSLNMRAICFKFTGPCTIYTQSRNPMDLKRLQKAAQQENAQQDQGGDAGDAGDGGE